MYRFTTPKTAQLRWRKGAYTYIRVHINSSLFLSLAVYHTIVLHSICTRVYSPTSYMYTTEFSCARGQNARKSTMRKRTPSLTKSDQSLNSQYFNLQLVKLTVFLQYNFNVVHCCCCCCCYCWKTLRAEAKEREKGRGADLSVPPAVIRISTIHAIWRLIAL